MAEVSNIVAIKRSPSDRPVTVKVLSPLERAQLGAEAMGDTLKK